MCKRLILGIILLTNLLLSVSCYSQKQTTYETLGTDTSADLSNIYITEIKDGELYKYNVKTGTTTPICDDPLCDQSVESCKFSGATNLIMKGMNIYYIKDAGMTEENGELKLIQDICAYNYSSGAFDKLYEIADGNQGGLTYRFDYYDGYLYFYRKVLENGNTRADLYRINTDSKKVDELFVSDDKFQAIIGDRIYYVDIGRGIYSLDMSGGEKKYLLENPDIDVIKASVINSDCLYYSLQNNVNETASYSLYGLNLETDESELISDNAPSSLFYGTAEANGMLYIVNVADNPTVVFTGSDGHKYYNETGGIIYAYNTDSKQTSIFYSDETLDITNIQAVGQYLVVRYNKQDGNAYLINADKLVLPLKTQ